VFLHHSHFAHPDTGGALSQLTQTKLLTINLF
jgi:hypothetical protein